MTPEELASRCADSMWSKDAASQALDMHLESISPGNAVLIVNICEKMVNGHGICHGGYIFLLADSAFAYACNTYNDVTVAQQCSITFLAVARLGDRLKATAQERSRKGRSGLYDVTIENQHGETVAEFRGNSRTTKGTILPD